MSHSPLPSAQLCAALINPQQPCVTLTNPQQPLPTLTALINLRQPCKHPNTALEAPQTGHRFTTGGAGKIATHLNPRAMGRKVRKSKRRAAVVLRGRGYPTPFGEAPAMSSTIIASRMTSLGPEGVHASHGARSAHRGWQTLQMGSLIAWALKVRIPWGPNAQKGGTHSVTVIHPMSA